MHRHPRSGPPLGLGWVGWVGVRCEKGIKSEVLSFKMVDPSKFNWDGKGFGTFQISKHLFSFFDDQISD